MAVSETDSLRFLVAVDDSQPAGWAFQTALDMMNKSKDALVLLSVVADGGQAEDKKAALNKARKILRPFAKLAKDAGVQCSIVASLSSHPALSITNYCQEQHIDIACLGRGRSCASDPITDDCSGSVSLYCVEHARCTVIVARSNPACLK